MTSTLYYRRGSSDKVYRASIDRRESGYSVTFAYGRRGSTLTTGSKTPSPVPLHKAQAIYDKLIASKIAKGYTPGEDGAPYVGTDHASAATGIFPQLANPIERDDVEVLLTSPAWCAQEKHDGRRLLVRKDGDMVTGINRRGLGVSLPEPIAEAAKALPGSFLIDGEGMGDSLRAFDLLEINGSDLREMELADRLTVLSALLGTPGESGIIPVGTSFREASKRQLLERVEHAGGEGLVLKRVNSTYHPGRPASGGDWIKFKFTYTASFLAGGVNFGKRSIALYLLDRVGKRVPAGNVTIPPNHEIPQEGVVVDVRYAYAFSESGSVYQPVYLGERDDILSCDCTTAQIYYKPGAVLRKPVTA